MQAWLDERALLRAWAGGDLEAAAVLIERYNDALHRFFSARVGADAEELMQRTLLDCLEQRERLDSLSSFRAYLFGIARHRLIDHFRARERQPARRDSALGEMPDPNSSPSRKLSRRRDEDRMMQALRSLPRETQLLLELFYWYDLSGSEVAEVLGIPEGTVRSRLRAAKRALTERLQAIASEVPSVELHPLDDPR